MNIHTGKSTFMVELMVHDHGIVFGVAAGLLIDNLHLIID